MGLLDNYKPLEKKGEGSYLRQQFPSVYGALAGLLGTAPDEIHGSVMDANTAAARNAAGYTYLPGLVASAAPVSKGAGALAMLAGMTKAGKGEEALSAVLNAKKFVYPQEQALATAQRNAAKPISEGGLGLRPDNTPLERAQAMGFDADAYHGTPDDRLVRSRQFKNEMLGKQTRVNDASMGHFTANDGSAASEYIWRDGSTEGGNVLPLRLAGDRTSVSLPGEWQPGRFDNVIGQAKRGGYDGLTIKGTTTLGKAGDYQVTFDPKNIRSRFAAFDPARRDSPDLLAAALPFGLLADEDIRAKLNGK